MKNIILLFSAAVLLFASCKKDDKNDTTSQPTTQSYEQRIAGQWDLVAVSYDTEIPNIQDPTEPAIQVSGEGKDVSGKFILTRNPNEIDYNLNFTAEVDPFNSGTAIPVPVNFGSSGTWTTTSDASKLIVTDENDEEILFNVDVNEQNKQTFSATITQTINMGIPLSLAVDIVLSFERAN